MINTIIDICLGAFVGTLMAVALVSMIATAVGAIQWAQQHNNYED